jgi:hypothetical protein
MNKIENTDLYNKEGIERMKKYLTIIMAITLLITGTGMGFCEESKETEIQNSQTLKEQVESKTSKGKIAKAVVGIIFSTVLVGLTMSTGETFTEYLTLGYSTMVGLGAFLCFWDNIFNWVGALLG